MVLRIWYHRPLEKRSGLLQSNSGKTHTFQNLALGILAEYLKFKDVNEYGCIRRFFCPDFVGKYNQYVESHMIQTRSGLLRRRWGVGGEVKTERNALSLSLSVLSVGTVQALVTAECCHYVLLGACTQRPLLCVSAFMYVCARDCVYAEWLRATLNLQWHF